MSAVHINQEQFRSLIRQETPVLVNFRAPHCVYCRKIDAAYDRLARNLEGKLAVTAVNIDDHPELAREQEIEVVPTLVLYQNGRELASIVAPESQSMIECFLRQSLEI